MRTLQDYTLHNMVTKCQFWNETTSKWETTGIEFNFKNLEIKIIYDNNNNNNVHYNKHLNFSKIP